MPSSKQKLKTFLLNNKGKILTSRQLQAAAAPATEWARRVRELRDQEGWPIETHSDNAKLKQNQYRLKGNPPSSYKFSPKISASLRAKVLDRNGSVCQRCGVTPDDPDPMNRKRKAIMQIDHRVPLSQKGKNTLSNLRTLCTRCNAGLKNTAQQPETWLQLKAHLYNAAPKEQKRALKWLQKKYGK